MDKETLLNLVTDGGFLYAAELDAALRAGALREVSFEVHELTPAQNIADVYSRRATLAKEQGRSEAATAFQAIANACDAQKNAAIEFRAFENDDVAYVLFVASPSNAIAGCLKFPGLLRGEHVA